jgi:ferritin
VEENDFTSNNFLQWFVEEQVEEIDTMTTLLQTIQHAAGNMLFVEDFVRRFDPHEGEDGGE